MKNNKTQEKKLGRAGTGVPGYKRINILIPETVHRRRKIEAELKGFSLKKYLTEIIASAS